MKSKKISSSEIQGARERMQHSAGFDREESAGVMLMSSDHANIDQSKATI